MALVATAKSPCAVCLGDALRRGRGWLRVGATCPVCRDSPVPSPLAEAVALAPRTTRMLWQ
ncbi:hypothetical protein EJB05_00291, partial [Eragrostis curvula]